MYLFGPLLLFFSFLHKSSQAEVCIIRSKPDDCQLNVQYFNNLCIIFGYTGSSLLLLGFSLVAANLPCAAQASHCFGLSCCGAQALDIRASVVATCGLSSCSLQALEPMLSCSMACRLFPDQGLNPCPLHWQADSYPLYYQGSLC